MRHPARYDDNIQVNFGCVLRYYSDSLLCDRREGQDKKPLGSIYTFCADHCPSARHRQKRVEHIPAFDPCRQLDTDDHLGSKGISCFLGKRGHHRAQYHILDFRSDNVARCRLFG